MNHPAPQLVRGLQQCWQGLLNVGFGLLCARFLFAAISGSDWLVALLAATGFALAWWRPSAGLFAVALGFSLLSGLEKTILLAPYSALLVVASSIWLGVFLRRPFPPASESSGNLSGWITSLVDLLATLALLFLAWQTWGHRGAPEFREQFWHQAIHGTGNPAYFLTSAFLWLQGLFYFRAVRAHPESGLLTPGGIKLVFLVNAIVLLLFFGVEWLFEFPARWTPGFQSPYEDIATLGIMATCGLLLCLALIRRDPWPRTLLLGLGALLLAVAVGASWSRGTWLACAVFLSVLGLLRLPLRLTVLLLAALLSAIVCLNLYAERIFSADQLYAQRLISLVRPENLLEKNPDRFELYHKAIAMIHTRPWTGHGLGSFYGTAPAYSRPGDPNADIHQLPHNILLQLASEQGLPVAGLFICLVGAVLWRGARCWVTRGRPPSMTSADLPETIHALVLALTLMLGAYLQANLTWDMLLVHPTQPFFFWYLVAALWATAERVSAPAS